MSIRMRIYIGKAGRIDSERHVGFYRPFVRVACCDMSIQRNHIWGRRRTRLTSTASAILCLGVCLAAPIAAGMKQVADRLYETALEQVGIVTVEESLEAFPFSFEGGPGLCTGPL